MLLEKLGKNLANREKVEAIVVGGANNIYEQNKVFQENIDTIKKELFSHHIKIVREFLGGISERSIVYDTKKNSLYLKKKWESEFRKVI